MNSAMNGRTHPGPRNAAEAETDTSFMTVKEVAQDLQVSESKVWKMVAAKEYPRPFKFGGVTRWRRVDHRDWYLRLRDGGGPPP